MKYEQVGNVKLNLEYYSGKDKYSDGDVENELLEIAKSGGSYNKYINESNRFEVFYHFSKEREMIVQAMDISSEDSVLEIGAGCGAITGALADKAKSVECIELSKRRSLVNAYRHKHMENIVINVGNYEDIKLNTKYNIITLIGVLEYAGMYIHSLNPYEDFLIDIGRRLYDGGILYVAIENRLGIKYFAGCKEDHLGKEFVGIEGYTSGSSVKTFSYFELINMFEMCGFSKYKFYYPYPDYKFPHKIFSDDYLPRRGEINELASNYTSSRKKIFNEIKMLDSLSMKDEFKIFTNSFLIELRK
jgi:2-polyprenyl-3-methyl-5-hydroxy-6-metoxy-1,4-benzoquinol methylase